MPRRTETPRSRRRDSWSGNSWQLVAVSPTTSNRMTAGGAVDVTGHAGGPRPPVSVWRGDTPDWRWSAKERQFAIAAASHATSQARSTTMPISERGVFQIFSQLMWWEYQPNIVPRLGRDISFDVGTVKLATYWNNNYVTHMSAQCYEHRFGYCTNTKTCFNVHFRPILAKRRVLLGSAIAERPRCGVG